MKKFTMFAAAALFALGSYAQGTEPAQSELEIGTYNQIVEDGEAGDDNTYFDGAGNFAPTNFCYQYTGSQIIYTKDELANMAGKDITAIKYLFWNESDFNDHDYNIKVYLQEVDNVNFIVDEDSRACAYIEFDNANTAADINYTLSATDVYYQVGEFSLTLDKPFHYSGEKNLLVTIVASGADGNTLADNYSDLRFFKINDIGNKFDHRCMTYANDNYDFFTFKETEDWPAVKSGDSNYSDVDEPVTKFVYQDAAEPTPAYTFSGGTGTEADPYLISNTADLDELNKMTNDGKTLGQYYKLTTDITTPYTGMIGTEANFNGNFDGDGYCITLNIDRTSDSYPSGLFGTTTHGSIRNLAVDGTVNVNNGAAIVGNPSGGEVLENLVNYANVTATSTSPMAGVGGIAGNIVALKSDSIGVTVRNCANFGTITCEGGCVGGVIGYSGQQLGNTLENLANYGRIVGHATTDDINSNRVAGVVGNPLYNDKVHKLVNFGTISNDSISPVLGNANPTDQGELFYDMQYVHTAFGNESQEKWTTEAVGEGLKESLGDGWTYAEQLFPRPTMNGLEEDSRALLFATPVILDGSNTLDSISKDFECVTENGVTWTSKNGNVEIAADGKAILKAKGADTLIATLNGDTHEIPVYIYYTEDGADGINTIEAVEKKAGNEPVFNLAGQRVGKSYKGVVIVNGKKMVR